MVSLEFLHKWQPICYFILEVGINEPLLWYWSSTKSYVYLWCLKIALRSDIYIYLWAGHKTGLCLVCLWNWANLLENSLDPLPSLWTGFLCSTFFSLFQFKWQLNACSTGTLSIEPSLQPVGILSTLHREDFPYFRHASWQRGFMGEWPLWHW